MFHFKASFQLFSLGALSLIVALQAPCTDPGWPSSQDPRSGTPPEFAAVTRLLAEQQGRVSCLVINPAGRVVFAHSPDERYELASVAKVYILVSYLDRLAQEQRGPTAEELAEMGSMITQSDNAPATRFFHALGAADGINAFLQSKGQAPLEPAWDGSWGSMRGSPFQVSMFLRSLYLNQLLPNSSTYLALSLLASVIQEQAWGVGSATESRQSATVYLKNGWLPSAEGWIVHSAGVLSDSGQQYIFVFMTDGQASFEQPVKTIEAAVQLLENTLAPSRRTVTPTANPLDARTPVPSLTPGTPAPSAPTPTFPPRAPAPSAPTPTFPPPAPAPTEAAGRP